jgi:hypothetical protein
VPVPGFLRGHAALLAPILGASTTVHRLYHLGASVDVPPLRGSPRGIPLYRGVPFLCLCRPKVRREPEAGSREQNGIGSCPRMDRAEHIEIEITKSAAILWWAHNTHSFRDSITGGRHRRARSDRHSVSRPCAYTC